VIRDRYSCRLASFRWAVSRNSIDSICILQGVDRSGAITAVTFAVTRTQRTGSVRMQGKHWHKAAPTHNAAGKWSADYWLYPSGIHTEMIQSGLPRLPRARRVETATRLELRQ
jgi:hypothetical protein